jgi:hypothetical protein
MRPRSTLIGNDNRILARHIRTVRTALASKQRAVALSPQGNLLYFGTG